RFRLPLSAADRTSRRATSSAPRDLTSVRSGSRPSAADNIGRPFARGDERLITEPDRLVAKLCNEPRVRIALAVRQAGQQINRPRGNGDRKIPQSDRVLVAADENQRGLPAANQFEVDVRQYLGIQERAVLHAPGIIDAVPQ